MSWMWGLPLKTIRYTSSHWGSRDPGRWRDCYTSSHLGSRAPGRWWDWRLFVILQVTGGAELQEGDEIVRSGIARSKTKPWSINIPLMVLVPEWGTVVVILLNFWFWHKYLPSSVWLLRWQTGGGAVGTVW